MTPVNRTPFIVGCRPAQSVDGAWLQIVVVKGTFRIVPDGQCKPHPKQRAIEADRIHLDELGRSLAWASDLAPYNTNRR